MLNKYKVCHKFGERYKMKHYGLTIAEGSEVTNLTVPTGTSFPSNANVGELFYRTDQSKLYIVESVGGSPASDVWIDLTAAATANADTLDGLDSTQFLRRDQSDEMSGTLKLSEVDPYLEFNDTDGALNFKKARIIWNTSGFTLRSMNDNDTTKEDLLEVGPTVFQYKNNDVLTTADEGSGNGIDADTVDGVEATSFLRSDVADIKTSGTLTFDDDVSLEFGTDGDFTFTWNDSSNTMYTDLSNGNSWFLRDGDNGNAGRFGFDFQNGSFNVLGNTSSGSGGAIYSEGLVPRLVLNETQDGNGLWTILADGNNLSVRYPSTGESPYPMEFITGGSPYAVTEVRILGNRVLTTADEGALNALDADTVDGIHASQFVRSDQSDVMEGTLTIQSANGQDEGIIFREETVNNFAVIDNYLDNGTTSFWKYNAAGDTLVSQIVFEEDGDVIITTGELNVNTQFVRLNHGNAAISFDTATASDGYGVKRISCNDGSGNWTFRSGNYFSTTEKYTTTGDGAVEMQFDHEVQNGAWSVRVADIGTADGTITWAHDLSLVSGGLYHDGSRVLTTADEGSGNGVDADTLDGRQGTAFCYSENSTTDLDDVTQSGVYRLNTQANIPTGCNYGQVLVLRGAGDTIAQMAFDFNGNNIYWRSGNPPEVGGTGSYSGWRKIYHDGNQGSGSGLDADTLDTLNSDQFIRSDIDDVAAGNHSFYGTDTVGGYSSAPIELREVNLVTNTQTAAAYAPALTYHWGANSQVQLALESDGVLKVRDGTTHSTLRQLQANPIHIKNTAGSNAVLYFSDNTTTNPPRIWASGDELLLQAPSGTESVTISDNLIVTGNLTVQGTTVTVDSNTVNIADNKIVLNSDETGVPSQDAGIEIERGTSSNVQLIWNEVNEEWVLTEDGSTFYKLWHAGNDGSASGLDADTIDTLHASSFLRSDANDTAGARIDFDQPNSGLWCLFENTSTGNQMRFLAGSDDRFIMVPAPSDTPDYTKEFFYSFTDSRWQCESSFVINDDLFVDGGDLSVGQNDTVAGSISVYGGSPGNPEGGQLNLYLSADHDSVFSAWHVDVYQDILRVFTSNGTQVTRFKTDRVEIPTRLLTRSNTYPEYRWWWTTSSADNTWKNICDVTFGTEQYTGAQFWVEMYLAGSNWGDTDNTTSKKSIIIYHVAIARSATVLNDRNEAVVLGPQLQDDIVRVAKTADGVFELQVRQPLQNQDVEVVVRTTAENNSNIAFVENPVDGSTTGTFYTPDFGSGHAEHFSDIILNNRISSTLGTSYIEMRENNRIYINSADTEDIWLTSGDDIRLTANATAGGSLQFYSGSDASGYGGDITFDVGYGSLGDGFVMFRPATSAGAPEIRLFESDAGSSRYVGLKAPELASGSQTWTLPDDDPNLVSGYYLTTNTSGEMSFSGDMFRATALTSGNDLDSLSDGWYRWINSVPTNAPPFGDYGILLQLNDGSQPVQLAFGNQSSGEIAVRRADSGTFYNWTTFWNDANDGSGSGLDADTLDGYQLASDVSNNGQTFGYVPLVKSDGVMEVGRYIDFHQSTNDGIDFFTRVDATATSELTIQGSGRILTTGDTFVSNFDADKLDGKEGYQYARHAFYTMSTGASDANKWTKFASFTITSRYQDYDEMFHLLPNAHGSSNFTVYRGHIRVKQQDDFGNDPLMDVRLSVEDPDKVGDVTLKLGYVIVQNTPTTIVDFYISISDGYCRVDGTVVGLTLEQPSYYSNQSWQTTVSGLVEGEIYENWVHKDTVVNSGDFNTYLQTGIYRVDNWSGNGVSNGPTGSYAWGMLRVQNFHGSNYVVQEYIPDQNDGIWLRVLWGGTWRAWREIWSSGSDGTGSGLDADTLDGAQGSSYLRSDTSDTYSGGLLRVDSASNTNMETGSQHNTLQIFQDTANTDAFMTFHVSGDYAIHFGLDGSTNKLSVGGWSMGANVYEIWHAGNDGTGSGLDADTLDGEHSSEFAQLTNVITQHKTGGTWIMDDNITLKYGTGGDVSHHWDGTNYYTDFDTSNSRWDIRNTSNQDEFRFVISSGDFHADGNVIANSTTTSSDIKLKQNITPIEKPIEKIKEINGVEFEWKKNGEKSAGVIAQDVEKVLPQAVIEVDSMKEEGTHKAVNYDAITAMLVEVVKDQQKQIDELKYQIEVLQAKDRI